MEDKIDEKELLEKLHGYAVKADKTTAKKNMLFGFLWCVGGIVVTVITYANASSGGGGRYVVAWGAIVFGALQFLNGFFRLLK